jgi:uncharacterized membrane protein
MTTTNQATPTKLDRVSAILLSVPVVAALCLVFLFYIPGIDRAVSVNQLPKEVLSLKFHIAAYCLSYSLFIAGLFLTINRLLTRSMTSRLWIEGTAIIATLFAFLGLVFGMPASKSIWGSSWVWDIKLIAAIFATIVFVGISIAVVMTRFISSEKSRNASLLFLFVTAVVLCTALFLIGRVFGLTIHPQWFPELLFRQSVIGGKQHNP